MPRLEFVGQSERDDDYRAGSTCRLVNFYREPLGQGGKAAHVLKGVPRANDFVTMPNLFVRSMAEIDRLLYVLSGSQLIRVSASGSQTVLGETASASGSMIFGGGLGEVCTTANGRYFVWNGATMEEPTAGAFSAFGSGAFLGGYVLLTEDGGRRFQWSGLADAETLPGLNFATAESTDGNLLRVMVLQGRALLMKEDAIEQWAPTGAAGADAFSLIPGGVFEIGLKARALATQFSGGVFFVGDNNIAYITNGGQVQPISTPAVNTAISSSNPTHCFTYEDEGHIFCVVRFSDREAWAYDIVTGEWHERASDSDLPWIIEATTKAYSKWFGGASTGRVYAFAKSGTDDGQPLIRTAVSNTLYNEGRRFRVPMVEMTGRMGQGTITDTQEPQLMVRFSGDGGMTYGREIARDMGGVGEFGQLCRVRSVGSFRQLAMEVRLSDTREITLDAAANVVIA